MRVLVTGATGFIGGRLVPALLDAGHEVRVLVREAARYDAPDGVEVAEGDLLEPGSFEDALAGVDAAYYLVHSMRAGADYAERDRRAARNFASAGGEAGVARVVYLGGLGEERDRLSEHLRSRREVEHVLGEGDYDLTTLRAAVIVGNGSVSFEMVRQLAKRLPVMVTPEWVRTRCQPIAVGDVVAYLVGVLDAPETAGDTFEIGGPDVPKPVAHPLILGLKNAVVVTDHRIEEMVPVDLTPFDEAVARALDAGEKRAATTPL